MKKILFFAGALVFTVAVNAQEWKIYPMPEEFPANSAARAFPKDLNWMKRVKTTNEKALARGDAVQLVFDGDSITDGWQGNGRNVWAKHYAQYGAVDFGISGDRTEHVLWRLSQGQAKGLNPKLIALMIGTNNLGGNSAEQIADGVRDIVTEYRKICPGAVILLQAVFPRDHKPDTANRKKIKQLNELIGRLADDDKIVFFDFGDKFLEADGVLSPEVMPDFLHPNEKGYQIWADAIQPYIDKYLK
ncbi:MAG: GDSL-type esterase/lipase family protein [Verrucomicrobiales bacterium]|jgi:beta-glucosidase|nr:GDSL-type esterase/lipase family protein [Verrucomicrobiales bacterium]